MGILRFWKHTYAQVCYWWGGGGVMVAGDAGDVGGDVSGDAADVGDDGGW